MSDGHALMYRLVRGLHIQFMRVPINLTDVGVGNRVTTVREATPPWQLHVISPAASSG